MTEQSISLLDRAIDRLADAQDDLVGEERAEVVRIMQTLSDMTGSPVDIEDCLAAHAMDDHLTWH
jgi:hypothetical protein